ncbi:MAG: M48 family peptidase, partial [Planctomycetota bacterium]
LDPRGRQYDLNLMFDELNRQYFQGGLTKPHLGWSVGKSRRLLGHYDPAHRAIVINRALDSPKAPAYAVEYVLFHEMLHLKHPVEYRHGRRCVHSPEFKAEERRFARYEEALRFLKSF